MLKEYSMSLLKKWFIQVAIIIVAYLALIISLDAQMVKNENYMGVYSLSLTTIVIMSIPYIFPYVKRDLVRNINSRNIFKLTVIFLAIAFVSTFALELFRYINIFRGVSSERIALGSDQGTIPSIQTFGFVQVTIFTILAAFIEEVVFRYLPFNALFYITNYLNSSVNKVRKKWPSKVIVLFKSILFPFRILRTRTKKLFSIESILYIIVFSVLFALIHGPNISNFYMYFIPGIIFSVIYKKYGLVASTLYHAACNLFVSYSSFMIAKEVAIFILKLQK